jgi:preprotein translocase subunit SecG
MVCGSFMSILMPILVALHVIVCLLLVLVVLMQRPRSEGLGSAFGGGITDNVFGSQTTNVLARFTTWMAIVFFAITLLLSILTARANSGKTEIQKKLLSAPAPEAAAPATQPAAEEKAADAAPAMGLQNAIQTPTTEAPAAPTPATTTPEAPAPAAPAPRAIEPAATTPVDAAPPASTPAAPAAEPAQN